MSDIAHSDWCIVDSGGDLEDCAPCLALIEERDAYYGALYANRPHYSIDELRDAYSDPTEHSKLTSLLKTQGF